MTKSEKESLLWKEQEKCRANHNRAKKFMKNLLNEKDYKFFVEFIEECMTWWFCGTIRKSRLKKDKWVRPERQYESELSKKHVYTREWSYYEDDYTGYYYIQIRKNLYAKFFYNM